MITITIKKENLTEREEEELEASGFIRGYGMPEYTIRLDTTGEVSQWVDWLLFKIPFMKFEVENIQ